MGRQLQEPFNLAHIQLNPTEADLRLLALWERYCESFARTLHWQNGGDMKTAHILLNPTDEIKHEKKRKEKCRLL